MTQLEILELAYDAAAEKWMEYRDKLQRAKDNAEAQRRGAADRWAITCAPIAEARYKEYSEKLDELSHLIEKELEA
jgi:hypothetical protein